MSKPCELHRNPGSEPIWMSARTATRLLENGEEGGHQVFVKLPRRVYKTARRDLDTGQPDFIRVLVALDVRSIFQSRHNLTKSTPAITLSYNHNSSFFPFLFPPLLLQSLFFFCTIQIEYKLLL